MVNGRNAIMALPAAVLALMSGLANPAAAQSRMTEMETPAAPSSFSPQDFVRDPVIDCSTNTAYRAGEFGDFIRAASQMNVNVSTDCRSCHRSGAPRPGQGDRPRPQFATSVLSNRSHEAVEYQLRIGETGEWKTYRIEPGKTQIVSWQYQQASQNSSPKHYLKHAGSRDTPFLLQLFATPNRNLGNMYFFDKRDGNDRVTFWQPRQTPTRSR